PLLPHLPPFPTRRSSDLTFVALKLAWGEAQGRECIRSDTRPTEQRSPRPISAQPGGRHFFWAEALLLAPHRSTSGYALVPVRKRSEEHTSELQSRFDLVC